MRRFFYDSFQDYAKEQGVRKVDFILKNNEALSRRLLEERVLSQLQLITEFHNMSCGFNGYLKRRINNDTCKLVEEYKVQVKRLRKYLDKIKEQGAKGEVEKFLQEEGKVQLNRAVQCLDCIGENNYMDLISRSMKNIEVCLTDVDFDNLVKNQTLEIVNFEDVAYNLVEMDAYYLLYKLKKRGFVIDYSRCVEKFCTLQGLGEDSKIFILSLLSYPHEFMKIYEKYRRNKKSWTEGEYVKRFIEAIREDGISFINEVKKC